MNTSYIFNPEDKNINENGNKDGSECMKAGDISYSFPTGDTEGFQPSVKSQEDEEVSTRSIQSTDKSDDEGETEVSNEAIQEHLRRRHRSKRVYRIILSVEYNIYIVCLTKAAASGSNSIKT
ncbi:hypothetical protein ACJJTC_016134 [Scirpophaga incertulas]